MPPTIAGFHLTPRDRRALRALVPIVCGLDAARPGTDEPASVSEANQEARIEPIVRHAEATLASFSTGQRSAILLGLRKFIIVSYRKVEPQMQTRFVRQPPLGCCFCAPEAHKSSLPNLAPPTKARK